jgi:hypothetical protein
MFFLLKRVVKTPINGHALAVCKVKIVFRAIFGGFMREARRIANW